MKKTKNMFEGLESLEDKIQQIFDNAEASRVADASYPEKISYFFYDVTKFCYDHQLPETTTQSLVSVCLASMITSGMINREDYEAHREIVKQRVAETATRH